MGPQAAWGIALLRVVLGAIYLAHGVFAATTLGPAASAALIVRLGYPDGLATALAWYLIVAHVAGGLLLVVGWWTVVAALAQMPIMASAVFLLHWPEGFFMRAEGSRAAGYEFALLVLIATVALAALGPGALSLDGRRRTRRRPFVP